MVALADPVWIQGAFIALLGVFDWVGLKTKVVKTVGMVCRPCQAEGTQSEAAYDPRIMSAGPSYQERQCVQVQCS